MPQLSSFYGIIIYMYFMDHDPPYFHAEYAEHKCKIEIESLSLITGNMPPSPLGLIIEWGALHRKDLAENWELMKAAKS